VSLSRSANLLKDREGESDPTSRKSNVVTALVPQAAGSWKVRLMTSCCCSRVSWMKFTA